MAKGYSKDLRERVVSIVEDGESAREAARLLNVGASTAIRWIERWTTTGTVEAKPGTGHSRSPLNTQVVEWPRMRPISLSARPKPNSTCGLNRMVAGRSSSADTICPCAISRAGPKKD